MMTRKAKASTTSLLIPKSPPHKKALIAQNNIKFQDPISYRIANEQGYLDLKDTNIIAYAISIGTDDDFKSKYAERDILEFTQSLDELDANQILKALKNRDLVPDYAVFKAISHVYSKFLTNDQVACQTMFQDVIQPVLKSQYFQSNLNLCEKNDLKCLATIITNLRAIDAIVEDQEALKICKILQKAGNNANFIRTNFINKKYSPNFWKEVVKIFFPMKTNEPSYINTIVEHKECLLTDAHILFLQERVVTLQLLKALTHFHAINIQELVNFYEMSINEQFYTLINLLKVNVKHSFSTFVQVTQPYQRLINEQQVSTMTLVLKDKPLDTWLEYYDQILSAVGDIDDASTLQIIQDTFSKVAGNQQWDPITDEYKKSLEKAWDLTMQVLQEKQILAKKWQKELVFNIIDLLFKKHQKYVVVQLETGHGKSIICQELATMLHFLHKDNYSIITCANEFLSNYSEFSYCVETQQGYIQYISLSNLFVLDVTDQFVITDEHDVMAGLHSFHLLESSDAKILTAKYTPAIFKKSKALIAFSGTISSATKQQLNWMNPQALFVEIPSLKTERQKNVIKKFIHLKDEKELLPLVANTIQKEVEYENFIVIFENAAILAKFYDTYKAQLSDKKIYVFDDFTNHNNFAKYQNVLKQLSSYSFIVLTVKDGCRGVDFKGRSPAHVIIACEIDDHAGIVQALGRGSRDLKNISTGTFISKKDYEMASKVLYYLISDDQIKGKQTMINHVVGCVLHDQQGYYPNNLNQVEIQEYKVDSTKAMLALKANQEGGALELLMFDSHCKNGYRFDDQNEKILWKFIKQKYDTKDQMPEQPNSLNQLQFKKLLQTL